MIRKLVAAFVTILFAASLHSTALAFDPGDVFRATGVGQAPSNWDQRDSFAKTFARQAARMDALRKLAEVIGGVHIKSKVNVVKFEVVNDRVESTLIHDSKSFKLLEKNARQVGEAKFYFNDDGKLVCEVNMELVVPADWKN